MVLRLTPAGFWRAPALPGLAFYWCEWRDSNSHGFPHWHLKPGRLPIPPHSHTGSLHHVTLLIQVSLLCRLLLCSVSNPPRAGAEVLSRLLGWGVYSLPRLPPVIMQPYPRPAEPTLGFPRPRHNKETCLLLVPEAGLEPARPKSLPPQGSVSAIPPPGRVVLYLVPKAGLEPAWPFTAAGFLVQCVYQFHHQGVSHLFSVLCVLSLFLVPWVGLEPTRPFGHWLLRPACLPIPSTGAHLVRCHWCPKGDLNPHGLAATDT